MQKQTKMIPKSHHIRTLFAAFLGAIGIWLIVTSILVVWLNRTLTDTKTFGATVAPLVTKPAIQNFVAEKVTDQLMQSASPQDIATTLLPVSQTAGKTPEQLQTIVQNFISRNVTQIVQSPSFVVLWKTTATDAHRQFINQLNTNADQLTLDLSPAVTGVVQQLKQTDLAPVSDKISVKPDSAKLNLKGSGITKVHRVYGLFKSGTIAILLLAAMMIALTIILSVHHVKTIRRLLIITGVIELLTAVVLTLPSFVKFGGDSIEKAAALAFAQVLVRNLQIATLIIGVVCILAAIGSKLYSRGRKNGATSAPAPIT